MPTTQPSGPDETNLLLHGSGVVRRLGLGERPPYLEVDTGASGYRVVPGTQELFEALRQLPASALVGRRLAFGGYLRQDSTPPQVTALQLGITPQLPTDNDPASERP